MSSYREEIIIDHVYIGAYLWNPELYAHIITVADLCNYASVEALEQVLDDSPVASVKRVGLGEPLRHKVSQFKGAFIPLFEQRKNHPLGVMIDSTSGGKYPFYASIDISDATGFMPPDRDYSRISLSLDRKELKLEEVDEFKKLFLNVAVTTDAFYGRCAEDSMLTQREVFMAKAAKNVLERKKLPDFSREIWDIYWLNYFGPAFIELWGRDKIDALAERYEVGRLDNGGICVQTTPEPVFADEKAKGITDYEFKKHFYEVLGYNTFMHETHKQGRSGQYVPTLDDHRRALRSLQLK